MNELTSWRQMEAGRAYLNRVGFYEETAVNERFYRGDQWRTAKTGGLPTPVFNFIRRIVDWMIAQIAADSIDITYSDERLPFLSGEDREKAAAAVGLCNRVAAYRWEQCRMDRMVREVLLDAALSGSGAFYTWWDPSQKTGFSDGDFVTTRFDAGNIHVADVNSTDIQRQAYVILTGRQSVASLRDEAAENGASEEAVRRIVPDGDTSARSSDGAAVENADPSAEKATFVLRFTKNRDGYVMFEKSTRGCVVKSGLTGLRLYPVAMFSWTPRSHSYRGASPVTPLVQNQKYVNKAYALMMKHMIDTAFSKVVYDKTRVPEWTNEVGQAIGVVGGDLDGVAKTISPGAMEDGFLPLIESVVRQMKDASGSTEVSLGEAAPDNASAILALQETNAVSLDVVRAGLYAALEELAAIWVDFMCAYYGKERMLATAGGAESFDCRTLGGMLMRARVDVGASVRLSKASTLAVLDRLLDSGRITLAQYLERIPDGVIMGRESLLDECRAASGKEGGSDESGE